MRGGSLAGRLRAAGAKGCAAALILAAPGCVSYSYVDAQQVQHVVGFVDVAMPLPQGARSEPAATAIATTTLGIAISRRSDGSDGFAVGYTKDMTIALPNGACLDLETDGVCKALGNKPHSTQSGSIAQ
ncbi:MAG: hypothetical protein WDM86_15230 [Rhizomicrobium sp.]